MVSLLEPAALLAFNAMLTAFLFIVGDASGVHPLIRAFGFVVITGLLTFVEVATLIVICRLKAMIKARRELSKVATADN